ncbi:hypothetical protein [Photobacterium sanguinicancri]|uniref:Uncharacterized protein n=1 Tax=Photobacterium sanguinicancri TaxID=875932 RepID=A0AAW7YAP2_9GAMM|nr:hypothetical protein [Photobacterium sanguinicancri]MDO6545409.1 hypothetical protein [Photobacterium sanguinicancri]
MYKPREIEGLVDWLDPDGVKIYTISADESTIDMDAFNLRLSQVKTMQPIDWADTAAFVIFHNGASAKYLVLVWWGNDNELFTSVSVEVNGDWVIDPAKYSFCLYDMEVMWKERNIYIETMDSGRPSLMRYRTCR